MILNVHAQREGAVNVAVLFFIGGLLIAGDLAVGTVRRIQQGNGAVAGNLQARGNGHDGHVVLLRQRGGDVAVPQVGQQDVGGLEGVMAPIALADDALNGGNAVVRQDAVQIGQFPIRHRPRQNEQLAAGLYILGEHFRLFPGDIRSRGVNHQRRGILGNFVHVQQGQGLRLHVFLFQLACEGIRQGRLAMALQGVEDGQPGADHIVDGGGNGALAVEGGGVGIGISTALGHIDVRIGHIAVLLPGDHHQRVVADVLIGVLPGKGGVHIRISLHHFDMIRQALIFGKQIVNDIVLLAGLDDPVNGHVLLQRVDHGLCIAGNGIEL